MSTPQPADRHELHNASVDETLATVGACAQVHLQTGRICTRDHGHEGSCDFTPADDARALTEERDLAEGS